MNDFTPWLIYILGSMLVFCIFRFIKLKEETRKLKQESVRLITKNESLRYRLDQKEINYDQLYKQLCNQVFIKNSIAQLSQEDIKSIINMIHPDKQPESRKQRANELFIKLRQLQN